MKINAFDISNFNTISFGDLSLPKAPEIPITFLKDDGTEVKITITLQYVQNVIVFSVEENVNLDELTAMLQLIGEEILQREEKIKELIADPEMPFDVFIASPEKLFRFGLSKVSAEPIEVITKNDDSEPISMYAVKVTGLNKTTINTKFTIAALTAEQKQDNKVVQAIRTLTEKHYPEFTEMWELNDASVSPEEKNKLFAKVVAASTFCYIVQNEKEELIGVLTGVSASDGKLSYPCHGVVHQDYRNRLVSVPLLHHIAGELGNGKESLLVTFMTKNKNVLKLLQQLEIDLKRAQFPISSEGKVIGEIGCLACESLATLNKNKASFFGEPRQQQPPPSYENVSNYSL